MWGTVTTDKYEKPDGYSLAMYAYSLMSSMLSGVKQVVVNGSPTKQGELLAEELPFSPVDTVRAVKEIERVKKLLKKEYGIEI